MKKHRKDRCVGSAKRKEEESPYQGVQPWMLYFMVEPYGEGGVEGGEGEVGEGEDGQRQEKVPRDAKDVQGEKWKPSIDAG